MRLVFAGTPEVAVPSLELIVDSGRHELAAVVTRPDAPAGRGRRVARSPVGQWADEHGVEVLTPGRPGEPEFLKRLVEIAPDCVPVVAYGALVPPHALDVPRHGWINLHFSLLPAWRGAAPVQHAVLHGDEITGASVFQLETGLDTGPVYGTVTEPIGPRDTAGDLLSRLTHVGGSLLLDVLDGIGNGTAHSVPQPDQGVSMAPKLTAEDARVRWQEPAFAVDRRIRACSPAPGPWSTFREDRIRLWPVSPAPGDVAGTRLEPGELRMVGGTVLAGTGTTPVVLAEVQSAGKKRMPADAWLRGVRLTTGERLT